MLLYFLKPACLKGPHFVFHGHTVVILQSLFHACYGIQILWF